MYCLLMIPKSYDINMTSLLFLHLMCVNLFNTFPVMFFTAFNLLVSSCKFHEQDINKDFKLLICEVCLTHITNYNKL